MDQRIILTENDLIEAILAAAQNADADGGGALTMRELRKRTGSSDQVIRDRLLKLQENGRLECVPVLVQSIDGRTVKVPGYRLKA